MASNSLSVTDPFIFELCLRLLKVEYQFGHTEASKMEGVEI